MRLFFNYSIDCELPVNTVYTEGREREPFFHGPRDWDFAERSVRAFVAQMAELGAAAGTTLFVYPDVARHQQQLYCELADHGIEVALHLNGMRYSQLVGDRAQWLGAMSRDDQYDALRLAKTDLEQTLGRAVDGYRACYGSGNRDTLAICNELGFTWTSNSSNRYRPEFHAYWSGSWRYLHHASAHSNLICGDLDLIEIPVTVGIRTYYDEAIGQPLDLRVETPAEMLGNDRERLRAIIAENICEMSRREVPVRTVIGASHNTNVYGDRTTPQAVNLDWTIRHARELAGEASLSFTPAPFEQMRQAALAVGSY